MLIQERKASWHKAAKKARKREEDLLTQTEELRCQTIVDKMCRVDLADCLGLLKKISDEAELLWLQEAEEVWNMFEQHMESWEPTEKNIDSMYEKAWQVNRSSDKKGKNLEPDWERLLSRAKEHGWSKNEDT